MNEYSPLTFVSLSRAQSQVFEQISDEEFWRYAQAAANAPGFSQQQADEYLVCHLGSRRCMLPLSTLREIIPSPHQLTFLPSVPGWMPGLTTWRNEIIAEIDLEAYLWRADAGTGRSADGPFVQHYPSHLLLVIQHQFTHFAIIVTAVDTTVHFDAKHMVPFDLAPDWCSGLPRAMIQGLQDDVLVLNIPVLFTDIVQQIKEQSLL